MRSDRRSPPVGAGQISPVAAKRCNQRTALAILTPKRWPPRCATSRLLQQRPQHVCEDPRKAPSPPPPSRGEHHESQTHPIRESPTIQIAGRLLSKQFEDLPGHDKNSPYHSI